MAAAAALPLGGPSGLLAQPAAAAAARRLPGAARPARPRPAVGPHPPRRQAARRPAPAVSAAGPAAAGGGPGAFLTLEEAGLVDLATDLSLHEKFLTRLTISSLNLLRRIAAEEGCPIEELNAGRVTDWFVRDAARRADDPASATLQW